MKLRLGLAPRGARTVTAWTALEDWLLGQGLPFEYVLYLDEQRLIEDAVEGRIDLAFVLPLAWIRARRLAWLQGRRVRPLVMREADRDAASLFLVRADSAHRGLTDLCNGSVGVGPEGPRACKLVPELMLRQAGLIPGETVDVRRLRGSGENPCMPDLIRSLAAGELDAMAVDSRRYRTCASMPSGQTGIVRVLARSDRYDLGHIMVSESAPPHLVKRLETLLLTLPPSDRDVRSALQVDDMTHWGEARTSGYQLVEAAADELGVCDPAGRAITSWPGAAV